MLTKLSENTVVSDDDYQIRLAHHELEYQDENGYKANISIEDEVDPYCLLVFLSQLKYWTKPENKPIDKLQKKILKDRILLSLSCLSLKNRIE